MRAIPFSILPDGLTCEVRLTPSGGADRIDGVGTDSAGRVFIKARVRAAPEDGKANAALAALFAKAMGVPKSGVSLIRGEKSRLKSLHIVGAPEDLARALTTLLGLERT